jgi:hypothetical protein
MIVAEHLRCLIHNHFLKSSRNHPGESSAVSIEIAEYLSEADSTEQLMNQAVEAIFECKREYYAQFLRS